MLILRTPAEIFLAYMVAMSMGGVGGALARSFGWQRTIVSTVDWSIDLGVEVGALCVWGLLYLLIRWRNDRRDAVRA